jgi:hypothetical protein
MEVLMKINKLMLMVFLVGLALPLSALAGNHYHGHGCMLISWDMTDMDRNGDGELSFEEYVAPSVEKQRSGFDMIDADKSGYIDLEEWRVLLEAHGITEG